MERLKDLWSREITLKQAKITITLGMLVGILSTVLAITFNSIVFVLVMASGFGLAVVTFPGYLICREEQRKRNE